MNKCQGISCRQPAAMDGYCPTCWMSSYGHKPLPFTAREALWLIDGGESPERAARRAGVKLESLHRALLRARVHRPEVARAAATAMQERQSRRAAA